MTEREGADVPQMDLAHRWAKAATKVTEESPSSPEARPVPADELTAHDEVVGETVTEPVAEEDVDQAEKPVGAEEPVAAEEEVGAEEPVGAGEEEAAPEEPERRPRRRRLRRALARLTLMRVIAGLVVVVLVAAAGWGLWQARAAGQRAADRKAAAGTARADALMLATYDYGHLPKFFAAVKAASTPAFAQQFTQGAAKLQPILQQYKATSTGKVRSWGVRSQSGNHVTVLVVLTQSVGNTASKTPSTQTEAFEYGMVHQGGRWKLASATSVSG